MEIEKVEKYTDLYIEGRDVENYPTSIRVNICNACHSVVSVEWDHWEKHLEWHNRMGDPLA